MERVVQHTANIPEAGVWLRLSGVNNMQDSFLNAKVY